MIFRGKRLGLTMWGTEPVAAMARHAALAERIGFDRVWLIDFQLLCRDVTVSLTAILSATTTLRAYQPADRSNKSQRFGRLV